MINCTEPIPCEAQMSLELPEQVVETATPNEVVKAPSRSGILNLQDKMKELIATGEATSVEDDCVLTHYFTDGAYARELKMPAGALIVGKIHKHAHLNFITAGKVAVATEFGEEIFTAPYTFVSLPGTKRVVYIIEDTTWTTVHVTNETDLEKIEDHVIAKSYEDYEAFKALEFKKDSP